MTSETDANPSEAFVWVWLPGSTDPIVAGRLDARDAAMTFTYGRSYLGNPNAVSLYEPDLPLQRGAQRPRSGNLHGCIADAAPDAWGRRVIQHRTRRRDADLSMLAYLLISASDRIGALDFQASATSYVPRTTASASLADLAEAAARVEEGRSLPPALEDALLHGTSIGGARPKAALSDGQRHFIAKFSSSSDIFPVVKAEYAAMELARRAGLDVAAVELTQSAGRDVLLVERFDRPGDGRRRMMVSALTILNLHDADGIAGRYATYTDLADHIRQRFTDPAATLRELFGRITFNVLVGNTDDHPKNHAAFWDGASLSLTPAYDICPQLRTGGEAFQAMAYGIGGERISQAARCVDHAAAYLLDADDARAIVDRQVSVMHDNWHEVCEQARLSKAERDQLWQRQFLNPFSMLS